MQTRSNRAMEPWLLVPVVSPKGRNGENAMRMKILLAPALLGSAMTLGACAESYAAEGALGAVARKPE